MIGLLKFLIRYCSRLLETPGFRFKDSAVGKNSAEGSYVLLESTDAQIYISNEREQITLQVRSRHDPQTNNWFSFDLIARLLDRELSTGVIDTANSDLLAQNLDKIIELFTREKAPVTIRKLNTFKSQRAKKW